MTPHNRHPEHADVVALLVAPLVPSGAWIVLDGISRAVNFGPIYALGALLLGFYVIVVMEVMAMVLGLPLVRILKDRVESVLICGLTGAVIASVPIILLSVLAANPDSATSDGVATVENGRRTIYWYIELLEVVGVCSAFGACGGTIFWWVRRGIKRREARENA